MNAGVGRLVESIRRQGAAATLLKLAGPVADRAFDRKYGVETCGTAQLAEFEIGSENVARGAPYEPSRVLPTRRMLAMVRTLMPAGSVLVDFGCGKGRVLLLAAEQGFRIVKGVEFAAELCEAARRNAAAFHARHAGTGRIEVIEGDAAGYTIAPEENVFFFFHPFDEVVFSTVLANIADSVRRHPRRAMIVIIRPSQNYTEALAVSREFAKTGDWRFWGTDFSVYQPAAARDDS